jgi:hypothetical protein
MRTFTVPRSISRGCSALLAGTAAVASTTHTDAAEWTKHFRVGMQVTLNIEAEFSGGGLFDIPIRPGRYDNGYVLADSTGDPDVTTNWGYDTDDQFDPASRLMTFSRAESFSGQIGDSTKDDSPYLGLEAIASCQLAFRMAGRHLALPLLAGIPTVYRTVSLSPLRVTVEPQVE